MSAASTLTAWLTAAGASLSPSIAVVPDGAGVRVVATAPLAPGARLATLPGTAVLSAASSCIGPALDDARIGGGLALVMAVAAETARGAASRWAGYLSTLPRGGERVPLLWLHDGDAVPGEADALALLDGTDAAGRAAADAAAVDDDWETVAAPFVSSLPPAHRFTRAHFIAAATWVGSRAFGVGGGHGQALVPLADAFNHKASVVDVRAAGGRRLVVDGACMADDEEDDDDEGETGDEEEDHEDDENDAAPAGPPIAPPRTDGLALQLVICGDDDGDRGGLTLYTASAVAKGAEIFNTYGELANRDLLPKYGFCLAHNPFNAVAVRPAALLEAAARHLGSARAARARARLLSRDTDLLDPDAAGLDVAWPGGDGAKAGPVLSAALRLVARALFASDEQAAGWADAAAAAAPERPPPAKRVRTEPLGPVAIADAAAADPPLTPAAAAGVAAALRARLAELRETVPRQPLKHAATRAVAAALALRRGEEELLVAAISAAERVAGGGRED